MKIRGAVWTVWAVVFGLVTAGAEPPGKRPVDVVRLQNIGWRSPEMAATQHRWISSTGIWSSGASWDTGLIPGAGGDGLDTAILDGVASNVSVIGETPGGNDLFRIVSKPLYKGDIGSPSNPLVVQLESETNLLSRCIFRSRGNVYYESPTGTFSDVVVGTDTLDRVVSLSGTQRNIFVHSGKVEFPSTAQNITSLNVLGSLARVDLPIDGLTIGNLYVEAGFVNSNQSNWDRIEIASGRVLQTGTMGDGCDVVMYGGTLTYATTAAISTHNPDMWLWGGALDLSSLSEDLLATTLVIGPNATIIGNLIGQGGVPSGTGLVIDLRDEY